MSSSAWPIWVDSPLSVVPQYAWTCTSPVFSRSRIPAIVRADRGVAMSPSSPATPSQASTAAASTSTPSTCSEPDSIGWDSVMITPMWSLWAQTLLRDAELDLAMSELRASCRAIRLMLSRLRPYPVRGLLKRQLRDAERWGRSAGPACTRTSLPITTPLSGNSGHPRTSPRHCAARP